MTIRTFASGRRTRREVLRLGGGLAAGLPLALLVGCGDDEEEDEGAPPAGGTAAAGATSAATAAVSGAAAATWRRIEGRGTPPAARRDHSLTSDPQGRRVYLFAGQAASNGFNDLWAYEVESTTWTKLAPGGTGPAARWGHNAEFDAAKQRLIVFSGQVGSSFFSDVWAYEVRSNEWKQIAKEDAGPRRRYGGGGSYDASANALYVSHGFTNQGRFDDTWVFDLAKDEWRELSPASGATRPVKRCLLRTVFDPQRKRVLLFGGQTEGKPFLADYWAFDPSARAWREISGVRVSGRNLYSLVRRDDAAHALLFGGNTQSGAVADVWRLDLASDQWSEVATAGTAPAARFGHDAAWLPGRRSMLMFGGKSDRELGDLWELSFT